MTKKGLALALTVVMVWALAVPAFAAAEPFPDVPRDHWAYEAVESLRTAGLIEGYPDGTFSGERTFTRYEMAMVFSRILERLVAWLEGREALLISAATGEVISALGQEFAPELQELGITDADLAQLMLAMNTRIQALEDSVQRADDRAYRARLAAEQARALAMEAREIAERGLAIAEMAYDAEEVQAAIEAAEQANDRAYRARLAAEDARAQANNALQVAERALAIAEMNTAADEVAAKAAEAAQRAQRLASDAETRAIVADAKADRALERVDELESIVDKLQDRPVLGGEIRADVVHSRTDHEDQLLDPRGSKKGDKTTNESKITTAVALNATVEPADGVVVQGGLKLSGDVFGSRADDFALNDLFVKVTTPGMLRTAYFGTVTGEQVSDGFSIFALDEKRYEDEVEKEKRGGAVIETEIGSLSSRIIASRTNGDKLLFGISSTTGLAGGVNVGVDYVVANEKDSITALKIFGETSGVEYDWTYTIAPGDDPIAGSIAAEIGPVELGFDYYDIPAGFTTVSTFAREFDFDKHDMKEGYQGFTLNAGVPNSLFGFSLTGAYYNETQGGTRTAQAQRVDVSRTLQIGLPVAFDATYATLAAAEDLTHWSIGVGIDDYALTDAIAVNAGYKMENNPLDGNWKNSSKWVLKLEDDTEAAFAVEKRNTFSAGVSVTPLDFLTVNAGYERADHQTDKGGVVQTTMDFGADYTLALMGADVTLGYAYQTQTVEGAGFQHEDSPRTTLSLGVSRDLLGGQLDAKLKHVTGRGSDGRAKLEARDTVASIDYAYPIADGMDFTLSGKLGSSNGNDPTYDADLEESYYYASVKAGVGLKF